MTEELKIHINPRVAEFVDEVYVYRELDGHKIAFYSFQDGNIVEQTTDKGEEAKPFMTARRDFVKEFVAGIIKHGNIVGIQKPSETKTAGMLEAQTRHLEDLRTMLKLK